MGWFNDLVGKVSKAETIDFVFRGPLTVGGKLPELLPLNAHATYLQVDVKSLRLPLTREGVTRYHGVVHTFVDIAGRGNQAAQFATATTPSALAGLDPKNVSNILTINKRVVGPTPWNGGDLKLQIGLFSVVEQDLAGPFLSTITALSDKFGGAFVATAKPFIDIIGEGVKALSRQEGSVKLEVGLDITASQPHAGYYALVAASKDSLQDAKLDLDPSDFRLRVDGSDYKHHAYLIYGIVSAPKQDRWGEIDDLREAYQAVRQSIIENKQSDAEIAVRSFSRLALTSSELIADDADRLVAEVEKLVGRAFGGANRSKHTAATLPEFGALPLYGRQVGSVSE